MTVEELITGSLRLIDLYGATEPADQADLDDGLIALNELINAWNAEHLALYHVTNRALPVTATTASYTIGIGGTFSYPRPAKIQSAGIIQTNTLRSDLKLDTPIEWGRIPEKTVTAKLPLRLYYDNNYPVATIQLWPVPSENCTLDVYVWTPLDDVLTLAQTVDLPPAYAQALRYGLAVAVAPEYGKDPGPVVTATAASAKAAIVALNASFNAGVEDAPPQAA